MRTVPDGKIREAPHPTVLASENKCLSPGVAIGRPTGVLACKKDVHSLSCLRVDGQIRALSDMKASPRAYSAVRLRYHLRMW